MGSVVTSPCRPPKHDVVKGVPAIKMSHRDVKPHVSITEVAVLPSPETALTERVDGGSVHPISDLLGVILMSHIDESQ